MSAPAWQGPDFDGTAACAEVGGDLWFPEVGERTGPAKAVCQGCEVRQECLAWALTHDERHGVWGGLSERERRRLIRNIRGRRVA